MTSHQSENPKQVCEQILLNEKLGNIKAGILRSEVAVASRLLGRGLELQDAYEELYEKLYRYPHALHTFLGLVLSTAAFWNPEKIAEARSAREELATLNRKIASKAAEVANLLLQREYLSNTSGFSCNTHYHICNLIMAAGKNNHGFTSCVQERFEELPARFEHKYWPTLSDVMVEIASDAKGATPEASDPLTEVATSASRPSRADFFKALFAAIEENSAHNYGWLPDRLQLTDNTLASLVSCALDIDVETLANGTYVKRLRQRERDGSH